jgi:phage shock protein A
VTAARRLQPLPFVRREADELMDLVRLLAVRQEDFAAWLAERTHRLDGRVAASDGRHSELQSHIEQLEAKLDHLTRDVVPRQLAQRSQRIAVLQQQVKTLRGNSDSDALTGGASADRAGTALIYAGTLLLVWLVLWQLALALGFG